MRSISLYRDDKIATGFAANLQQTPEKGLVLLDTGPIGDARKQNGCSDFKSTIIGGGAWESNPPSTRKLAEQPF